jgi:hypothetical protein
MKFRAPTTRRWGGHLAGLAVVMGSLRTHDPRQLQVSAAEHKFDEVEIRILLRVIHGRHNFYIR